MLFTQLTYWESLCGIETCLRLQARFLYAMGIRGSVVRSNIVYTEEKHDRCVYFELAKILVRKA